MMDLTQTRLRELLHYDAETGAFTWRVRRPGSVRVGHIKEGGRGFYIHIIIDGRPYRAHRLAFLWMTGAFPPDDVDHKDGDGLNNSWANLRAANQMQNQGNAQRRRDNTSGFKGVTFHKRDRRWHARIKVGGRTRHLGYFGTAEEAHAAYCAAAEKHFGEFARFG